MKVTLHGIELDPYAIEDAIVADVRLDGHRVWSVEIPYSEHGVISLEWPAPLRARLEGRTRVTVHDSVTGREIGAADARFGRSDDPVEIVDARGRWLAMTKWDRLGPVLEGQDDAVVDRLLHSASSLVAALEERGHEVYIVGGTLLGLVRDGRMLPHDDDVDLAFLCREDNPADIALVSFEMERSLRSLGYTVVRHSLAHLEVEFFNEQGEPDHYVDIFTGFFRDGLYCQPFALRGPEVTESDLVPTRRREIHGVELPEPANPEAWLAYAYGRGWRVPDPTFKFETPRWTRHRFESWFGVYNSGRVFWDKHYMERDVSTGFADAGSSIKRFLADVPPSARILDLGCGDGRWSVELAQAGHRVTGVDYSHEALRLARAHDVDGLVDFRYLNLNDRGALLEFGARMLETGDEWCIFAHHTVQSITKANRRTVFLFLELVLRGRGFADLTDYTTMSADYEHARPATWHLPTEWIEEEIAERRLQLRIIGRGRGRDGRRIRRTAHVRVTAASRAAAEEKKDTR